MACLISLDKRIIFVRIPINLHRRNSFCYEFESMMEFL